MRSISGDKSRADIHRQLSQRHWDKDNPKKKKKKNPVYLIAHSVPASRLARNEML